MARAALDHSLIFHRLQEARQELFQARSGHPALAPHDRARLLARCEANVARAELELARATVPDVRPEVQPPLQAPPVSAPPSRGGRQAEEAAGVPPL
jgi:predicted RNA-binding Zn ribbon-like protein